MGSCFRKFVMSTYSLIWIMLAAHSYASGENEDILGDTIIFVRPTNFETILNSKADFLLVGDGNEDKTKHLLNTFSKYLIPFDFRNETDVSFLQLKRICKATAAHNAIHFGNTIENNSNIKLLISVIPHGGFAHQLELVSSVIQETNKIYNGTVNTFLINYRYQRLGPETLPLVLKDISLANHIVKNQLTHIGIGIIIDMRNCFGSDRYFRRLPVKSLDVILFGAADLAERNLDFFLGSKISCEVQTYRTIPLLKLSKNDYPKLGFVLPVSSELCLENTTFSFNQTNFAYVVKGFIGRDRENYILEAEAAEFQQNLTTDPVTRTVESLESWLRLPTFFNVEFTGMSISTGNQPVVEDAIIPLVWSSVCKILVHESLSTTGKSENLSLLVDKFHRTLMNSSPCDESLTEMLLAVNTFQDITHAEFHDRNRQVMQNLANFLMESEMKYPQILSTLVFNWNGCFGPNPCDEVNLENIMFNERSNFAPHFFTSIIKDAELVIKDMKFERSPKVGIMLHWSFCRELVTGEVQPSDQGTEELGSVAIIVFKMHIRKQRIMDQGALKTSAEAIASLQYCSSLLLGITWGSDQRTAFHVSVYGCDASSNNQTELTQVARFWELMNKWAVSVETTVIVGPAFECSTTTAQSSTNCSNKITNESPETCGCGWWRASLNQKDVVTANDLSIETKKSIALRLFGQIRNPTLRTGVSDRTPLSTILTQVLIPTGVLSVLIICTTLLLVLRYRRKHRFIQVDIQEFFKGRHSTEYKPNQENAEITDIAQSQPYNRERYEIPPSKYHIDYSKSLGGGAYGSVFGGTLQRGSGEVNIAIKMTKRLGSEQSHAKSLALKGLLSEIKVLSYLGYHQNVVQLVGAYTAKLRSGKLFVFLEICELGSLHKFLRSYETTGDEYYQRSDGEIESCSNICGGPVESCFLQHLYRWSKDIACGMEYISSKNIVHADLATRNVLLNSEKCAKISDFGLSRRLYDYTEYVKQEQAPLPWKWMAPESLRRLVFNEKSDVWAFGVTLWEIFTLGDEPYPGLSWEVNFPALLARGMRLKEPLHSDRKIYDVMKRCWTFEPDGRPSFSELMSILGE